jgi:hypothetical protein
MDVGRFPETPSRAAAIGNTMADPVDEFVNVFTNVQCRIEQQCPE